jgi:hypothetical protein
MSNTAIAKSYRVYQRNFQAGYLCRRRGKKHRQSTTIKLSLREASELIRYITSNLTNLWVRPELDLSCARRSCNNGCGELWAAAARTLRDQEV